MRAEWRFRAFAEPDIPRQTDWMNQPHVNQWWARGPVTIEQVCKKFAPRLAGTEPVHCYVAELEGMAAGYAQCYRLHDFPDAFNDLELPVGGWGFDWFIGDHTILGRKLGAQFVQRFIDDIILPNHHADYAVVGSRLENIRALRSYARAGMQPWFCTLPHRDAECVYRRTADAS